MKETKEINAASMYKMCLRKRGYKTEDYALMRAKQFEEQYKVKNKVYYCPLCNSYHITTIKEDLNEQATK